MGQRNYLKERYSASPSSPERKNHFGVGVVRIDITRYGLARKHVCHGPIARYDILVLLWKMTQYSTAPTGWGRGGCSDDGVSSKKLDAKYSEGMLARNKRRSNGWLSLLSHSNPFFALYGHRKK